MARRGGSWRARVVSALVLSALLIGVETPNFPASADTPLPAPTRIEVSARDTVAVASWEHTSDAGYTVDVDTSPGFGTARTSIVPTELAMLDSLQPATTYYLRVSAVGADGSVGVPSSTVSFLTSEQRFTLPTPVLTLDSTTSTSITPTWAAAGEALRYQVELGKDEDFADASAQTVTATSAVYEKLSTDTTYYARVRVVDEAGGPLSDWSPVESRKPATSLPLRVGSYNILKSADAAWSKRRTAVAATIRGEDPDVVGLQEATPRTFHGRRQYADVAYLLGSDWALTDATKGAPGEVRTVYNATRVTLIDHGFEALSGSGKFGVTRYATWAVFEQKSTQKRFIFVNTHFAVFRSKVKAHHTAAARQVVAMVKRVNTDHLPVVIVGDFNTGLYRTSSNGVYRTITGAGYVDPLVRSSKVGSAEKLIRADLKTYNGYTRKAPRDRWARMLDQIFVSKMRVSEWETVAKLNSSGRWIGTIPSDHNMLRATVYLP